MFFDLSQRIENGMTVYPGDPLPRLAPSAQVAAPWRVSNLQLGSHTGTHIDAPSHFLASGKSIDQYPLSRFMLRGVVVPLRDLGEDEMIPWPVCAEHVAAVAEGGAVVLQTDWSRHWQEERYFRHPFLAPETAEQLARRHIGVVAIDTPSVDSTVRGTSYAHEILLGNDVLIVENLTGLEQLHPGRLYEFCFLPLYLAGLDGSPVRAAAREP